MNVRRMWSMIGLVVLLAAAAIVPSGAAQTEATRAETLMIAIPGRIPDPTNLNLYAPGVSRSDTGLHQMIYEYFFYYNLQTGEFIPWLAEGFEYADDASSLTVQLREGVTWNDGEAFTADDVVFTYDLLRENPGMVWAETANNLVSSVEAIDDVTVQFNLTEPNPRFHLNREAFPAVGIWGGITILPQHIWEGEDPLTFKNSEPVGTGAYALANADQNAMTYELRDDWWGIEAFGQTPAPRTVQFAFMGTPQNVALALSSNELDSSNIGILTAGSFFEVAARNPNVSAWFEEEPYAWSDPCPRALMFQNANAPLDQADVRWALSSLIDRQAIVDLYYEGTTTPAWGIWPEYDANLPYFEAISDLRDEYPSAAYDPERAAELFEQAGVAPEDITLRYLVNADSPEEQGVAQIIADQLSAGGVNVEIQPLSAAVQSDARLAGDYDIALQAFCPGYIVENLELFHSKYYVPVGEQAPWYERNSFRYQNPELDAVIDEMFATAPEETEALIDLYEEAMSIWLPDLPVAPIVQAPALVPFNSTYWTNWPTADNPWNMPVTWWATTALVITGYPDPETGEWVEGLQPAEG